MRLIDADALREHYLTTTDCALVCIDEAPTIDAVEQKHGHWQVVKECEAYFYECSNCKGRHWEVEPEWIFCPYCACKMDEVTEL